MSVVVENPSSNRFRGIIQGQAICPCKITLKQMKVADRHAVAFLFSANKEGATIVILLNSHRKGRERQTRR